MPLANIPPVHRRRAALALVLTVLFGLFVLGAQPFAVNLMPAPWDKLAHAVVFALLACAIGLASGLRGRRLWLLAASGAGFIGVLDEWHQTFLPGRQAGWDDLAMDGIGSMLGAWLSAWWQSRSAPTSKDENITPR